MTNSEMAAGGRILCVDDESNILASLRRLFKMAGHTVSTAENAEKALEMLGRESFDVLVSDMRMPGTDGVALLGKVRASWPETMRILLTGHADISSAVKAINSGEVYRYLTKPWNDDELLATVSEAMEYATVRRDRERLQALTIEQNKALDEMVRTLEEKVRERTEDLSDANKKLRKSYISMILVFSNLIQLRQPHMMGHARQVADRARRTAVMLGMTDKESQDVFIAGLLHDIGKLGFGDELLEAKTCSLKGYNLEVYKRHPGQGAELLSALEDMDDVRAIIRGHHERFDGHGFPDGLGGELVPPGARVLAVAEAYEEFKSGDLDLRRMNDGEAQNAISRNGGSVFDPEVTDCFLRMLQEEFR